MGKVDANKLLLQASFGYPGIIYHSRVLQLSDIFFENRTQKFTICTPYRNKSIPNQASNNWRYCFPKSKLDNKALS